MIRRAAARRGHTTSGLVLIAALLALLVGAAAAPAVAGPAGAADRVLVLWHADTTEVERDRRLAPLGEVTATAADVDTVAVPAGTGTEVARRLSAHASVVVAEVDQPVDLAATSTQANATLAPRPDDPLFEQQWGLENTGQIILPDGSRSRAGVDVGARGAWAVTRGSPQVTVAIIDSGIDLAHPDLTGAFWQNPGEQVDGRDTNGNGYIDDVNGWDFVTGAPIIAADPLSVPAEAHGTQVAAVVAARSDDAFGVAGIAPEVRVLPLRAFGEVPEEPGAGRSTIELLVRAITYAVANGADLINASWESGVDSEVLERTVAQAGIPVIAAAGNSGFDLDQRGVAVPAGFALPNLVAVTAIDPVGAVPHFANLGASTIDLAAPGVGIVTATSGGGHVDLAAGARQGTSFAVPFVSGALALGRSAAPTTSTSDLLDTLLRTTVAEPSLAGRTTTGGRLDAAAFLRELEQPVCGTQLLPAAGFADVAVTSTHATAIDCIAAAGIANGFPDGTFRPAETVTRGQLASFLAGVLAAAGALPAEAPDAFGDDDGSVHEPAIDALAMLGIVEGDATGRVHPDARVTRGQLAAMLVRTHAVLDRTERDPTRSWFPDAADTTHARSIDLARDLGLVRGRDRVTFDAIAGTRRDQLGSTLARLLDSLARQGVDIEVGVLDGS